MATTIIIAGIYLTMGAIFYKVAYDNQVSRGVDRNDFEKLFARWVFGIAWPVFTVLIFFHVLLSRLGIKF